MFYSAQRLSSLPRDSLTKSNSDQTFLALNRLADNYKNKYMYISRSYSLGNWKELI